MHGFEREANRVDAYGTLSSKPHPTTLGPSLTHTFVTTDFCEPQLELITPPDENLEEAMRWLDQIQRHIYDTVDDELVWPFSMPPRLPVCDEEIPLAYYGSSKAGQEKTIYRSGIGLRYGRRRLTISGAHYSFSFDQSPLVREMIARHSQADADSNFDPWLHVVRNLYRRLPFLTYLFGASPAFDESFNPDEPGRFIIHRNATRYAPFATSLRMSDIGYTSHVQDALSISYDSLGDHIRDLKFASTTCNPDYRVLSDRGQGQLNSNFLQTENELYRPFRLQQHKLPGESLVDALRRSGTGRIEIRTLDIDPAQPNGIDAHAAGFMYLAMLDCFKQPSPSFSDAEWQELNEAHQRVVWRGREHGLKIPISGASESLQEEGKSYCESLVPLAEKVDSDSGSGFYQQCLKHQIEKWDEPQKTPSGKHLATLLDDNKEFLELGLEVAQEHRDFCQSHESDAEIQKMINVESKRSKTEKI